MKLGSFLASIARDAGGLTDEEHALFESARIKSPALAVVREHESISLSQDAFAAFLDALESPVKPNSALQRAYDLHDKQV